MDGDSRMLLWTRRFAQEFVFFPRAPKDKTSKTRERRGTDSVIGLEGRSMHISAGHPFSLTSVNLAPVR